MHLAERRLAVVGLILILAFAFLAGLQPIWEIDVWWHLHVGEWIVKNGQFPVTDLFSSIHPERAWRTFNWLFEVMLYGVHQSFGLMGLRIFIAMWIVTGFSFWFVYFKRETKNNTIALALLLLLFIVYVDRIQIRPHVVNLTFEALIVLFFQSDCRLKKWKQRTIFFLIAVLWANLHNPCAALGVGVVLAGCLARVLIMTRAGSSLKQSIVENSWPAILGALAIACNPYGTSLLFAGADNISPVYFSLGEWKSPLYYLSVTTSIPGMMTGLMPLISFLMLLLILSRHYKNRSFQNSRQDPWLGKGGAPVAMLGIAQTSLRFSYLSISSVAWMIGKVSHRPMTKKIACILIPILALVLCHYQFSLQGGVRKTFRNLSVDIWPGIYPEEAVKLIRDAKLSGKIYTHEKWGGYLLWFADPAGGVSSDSRNNFSAEVQQLQNQISENEKVDPGQILSALDQLGVDIALLNRGAFPYSHWPTEKWIRIAHDSRFEVFLRTQTSDMERMRTFFNLPMGTTPQELQMESTKYFGERYYLSKQSSIQGFKNDPSENAVHSLASIEWLAGHDLAAKNILVKHLKTNPTCIRAATEIALILHDEGNYREAVQLLSPIGQTANVHPLTRNLWEHLSSHQSSK